MKEDGIHMNINKLNDLTVGMTFKNYKELVAYFDEEVKGGKGKTYQLENFKRYFDYEKQGNKFIITAIHETPTEKKLRGKTATVGKELDALKLYLLAHNKRNAEPLIEKLAVIISSIIKEN